MVLRLAASIALCLGMAGPAAAAADRALAIFGGPSVVGLVWRSETLPLVADHGGQYQLGIAGTRTLQHLPRGMLLEGEVGLSLRRDDDTFGPSGTSLEAWAGPALRHEGIPLGPVLLRPAVTIGLSAVTASHGLERDKELDNGGDAALLYFLAPEISLSLAAHPRVDFVYRGQHRSGGKNVYLPPLGNMGDANNANIFGIRWRF